MLATSRFQSARSYFDHVKLVLEGFAEATTLGEHSPLAAPYFLGSVLHGQMATPVARGELLRAEIDKAITALWGGPLPTTGPEMLAAVAEEEATQGRSGRYDCLILELNYLKRCFQPPPKNQAEVYHDILHISRPTHDRHLRDAVDRLGAQLLQRLRPAIRPEQPSLQATLLGRSQLLAQILSDLEVGKAVSLTGAGGVGKTSLGVATTEAWDSPAIFWYTFRPTLNDQIDSLLFAVGQFLHEQGASALWHQLVADGGRVKDGNLAAGLARNDLRSLTRRPLLCFDELDFLRPLTSDQPNPHHVQLLELIDSLRADAPLLLIGQRAFWESDRLYSLEGLSLVEVAEWLAAHSIVATDEELARLYRYTGGNPRLLELCGALYGANPPEPLSAVLDQLPQSPALLPLWQRLERRLPGAERRLMHALSVFRLPAPADAWLGESTEQADALTQLLNRGLVRQDEQGGIFLLPALREVVYSDLEVEIQEEHHLRAAQIRAERGEYTAAAHHLQRADQPEAAVELWFPQRAHEIGRGQAGAALAIFAQVSQRRLSPRQRKNLLLLRAELNELAGAPQRVIDELAQTEWPLTDPATPEAMSRLGQALDAQGQAEAALEIYQAGLDAVAALLRQGGQLHVQRSLTQLRQRQMQQAWREANLARFQAETMLGIVYDQRGDYAPAHAHYTTALAVAEETVHLAGIAQTHHYLAMLAGRQLDMERALPHFEKAISFYEHVGDRVNREYVRGNLASAYIQSHRFGDAIAPAEQALHFFRTMGNPFRTAQNASNLAEAHAELGNLEEAQQYAELVLEQEEPHSHPYALYTLGTVYLRRGDWSQAEAHYEQSRKIAEANDDIYLQAFAWRALGEVYQAQGRTAQATGAFTQALDLFRYLNIADEARQTEQLLDQCDAKHTKDEA